MEHPAALAALLRYSPYHNVTVDVADPTGEKARRWPPAMFSTGDSDTRVAPVHSCKMVALLQGTTEADRYS